MAAMASAMPVCQCPLPATAKAASFIGSAERPLDLLATEISLLNLFPFRGTSFPPRWFRSAWSVGMLSFAIVFWLVVGSSIRAAFITASLGLECRLRGGVARSAQDTHRTTGAIGAKGRPRHFVVRLGSLPSQRPSNSARPLALSPISATCRRTPGRRCSTRR